MSSDAYEVCREILRITPRTNQRENMIKIIQLIKRNPGLRDKLSSITMNEQERITTGMA